MKCMHCLVEFHQIEEKKFICIDKDEAWYVFLYQCPSCGKANLYLVNADIVEIADGRHIIQKIKSKIPIRPKGSHRPPCPTEVSIDFSKDYNEACITLFDSSKASAALSRRCLQNILRENRYYSFLNNSVIE